MQNNIDCNLLKQNQSLSTNCECNTCNLKELTSNLFELETDNCCTCNQGKNNNLNFSNNQMLFYYGCDLDLYNNLLSCIGKTVCFKLSGNNCLIKLKLKKVNPCSIFGITIPDKRYICIKLSAIEYVDFGKEVYINPECNIDICSMPNTCNCTRNVYK